MSVTDIFELGVHMGENKKYTLHSIQWLTAALNQLKPNDTDTSLKLDILNSLASSYEKERK